MAAADPSPDPALADEPATTAEPQAQHPGPETDPGAEQPDPSRLHTATGERIPTIIVDNLRVAYKVYNSGGRRNRNAPATLWRLLKRERMSNMRVVNAIRGVSFTTYRGESVGLIGRNGSGKSTLLRAIAGLLPPTSGAVYAEGQPSLLGVNAALLNDLSGERNVTLGCLAMGMTQDEADAAYDDIVDFSGLRDHIDLPMRTYSSGMQQRLRFAIAAAQSHDVLLIDEALATGDRDFRRRSEERIRQMRDQAGTVILVSHGLEVVRETCTRAIWLHGGKIRMDGSPKAVIRAYKRFEGGVGARRGRNRAGGRRIGGGQPGQGQARQGQARQGQPRQGQPGQRRQARSGQRQQGQHQPGQQPQQRSDTEND